MNRNAFLLGVGLIILLLWVPLSVGQQIIIQQTGGGGSGTDTNCSFNVNCTITGTIDTNRDAHFDGDIFVNDNLSPVKGLISIFGNNIGLPEIQLFDLAGNPVWTIDTTFGLMETPNMVPVNTFPNPNIGTKTNRYGSLWLKNDINFGGNLTGGHINYSIADSNSSQSCPAGQALQSVGLSTSCISVSGSGGSGTTYTSGTPATIQVNNDTNTISQNFDGNLWGRINLIVPWQDVNIFSANRWNADVNWQEVSLLFPVSDSNIAQSSLYKRSCDNNTLCTFTGLIKTTQNADLNGALTHITKASIDDLNANTGHFDGNVSFDQNILVKNSLLLDGNIVFNDANDTTIGTPTLFGKSIAFQNFDCYAGTNGGPCLMIPAGSFAFKVRGSGETGMDFNGVGRYTSLKANGVNSFEFGISGGSTALMRINSLTNTAPFWAGTPANKAGTLYNLNFQDPAKGHQLMWDQNGNGIFQQLGSHQVNDLNVDQNIWALQNVNIGNQLKHKSGFSSACAGMNVLVAGTVTVATTCMKDVNSMVQLTAQNQGTGFGGVRVGAKTFGSQFTIVSTSITDDANVFWQIIQLYT